ncbi:MAG: MAPEG family protein [Acetobacteraceae bacterium]|nr:MAPEG family protein [Acetobacteraceae bacterium]
MRRKSALLSTVGLIIALLVWRLLASLLPIGPASTEAQRLGIGLAALLPPVGVLILMILAQMLARGAARVIDPTAGQETRLLLVNQRVITNSVEQLAIFAPALLALAAPADPTQMAAVAALGGAFALARLLFWAGYLMAPLLRAPGMAATAGITVATWLAACWAWLI